VTPRRLRTVVAAAAALVLGGIGWWLFSGGGGAGGPGSEDGQGARPSVSHSDTMAPGAAGPAARGGAAPGAAGPAGAGTGKAAASAVPKRAVEGVCALEDGVPLAGVLLEVPTDLWKIEGPSHLRFRSGVDGTLRFEIEKSDAPIEVRHEYADVVAVEGATIEKTEAHTAYVRVDADRIRLSFREKPGFAHVRLVNADTGEPVTNVAGLRVEWLIPGGRISQGYPEDPGLGGWIAVPEGRLPETGAGEGARIEADLSNVVVSLRMPGFEQARLDLKDVRGRMQVRVRPVPPDATGEIVEGDYVVPAPGEIVRDPPLPVTAHLRWTGGEPEPLFEDAEVPGLPTRAGKFALYGLGEGTWELEVAATVANNTVLRGKRAFETGRGTVDLGKIVLQPSGKVVLRVVDAAGKGIPQAWALVCRPDEDVEKARRLDLDGEGAVSVGDLEPGVVHRAVVRGLPREMEQSVKAGKDPKPVEFRWPEKLVPCRLTLIVDGKAVSNPDGRTTIPALVQETPLPRDKGTWGSDGVFQADLVPGTYRFSALATPKEGGSPALFAGEVTVPSGDAFEARVELQREGR
jgi:hypothetical protein